MNFIVGILLLLGVGGNASHPDEIMGKWFIKKNEGIVEIIKSGDKYYGKLVWLEKPNDPNGFPRTDDKNPDPVLSKRPLLGIYILMELEYIPKEDHWHGKFYSPRNGQSANAIVTVNDENTITVMGYVGSTYFSKSEVWTRAK